MHISYNGVSLEVVTLDRIERRSVMSPDETTVLYIEWAISLSCVYHPDQGTVGGTSITFENFGDRNPGPRIGSWFGSPPQLHPITMGGPELPIYTDRELLLRLSIPRKPLIIWSYEATGDPLNPAQPVVWLRSPNLNESETGYLPRDAKAGPIVQANVVTAALGNAMSFGVQMEIKTWVPPCPDGSDRLILGHRWQMTHTQDENNYLTRAVAGEMWFHGGIVDEFQVRADAVSRQLLHPIPLGFRRYLGPIALSPDGLVLRYSYADVDQKVVFDPGRSGATTIAISENIKYRVPFQGSEVLRAALNILLPLNPDSTGGRVGNAVLGGVVGGAVAGIPGMLIGGAVGAMR